MLTPRLNAKFSTSVQLMELVALPSTAFSVPMVPSSTRTTSSVTGGSILTALKLRVFTLSMMKLLLSVNPLMLQLQTALTHMYLLTPSPLEDTMLLMTLLRMLRLLMAKLLAMPEMDVDHQHVNREISETVGG